MISARSMSASPAVPSVPQILPGNPVRAFAGIRRGSQRQPSTICGRFRFRTSLHDGGGADLADTRPKIRNYRRGPEMFWQRSCWNGTVVLSWLCLGYKFFIGRRFMLSIRVALDVCRFKPFNQFRVDRFQKKECLFLGCTHKSVSPWGDCNLYHVSKVFSCESNKFQFVSFHSHVCPYWVVQILRQISSFHGTLHILILFYSIHTYKYMPIRIYVKPFSQLFSKYFEGVK